MDTLTAFAMASATQFNRLMVFDWIKAAKLIKESGCSYAEAGLEGDWEWTGGIIFEDGKPTNDYYTYLASTWATPQILINGKYIDCYTYETSWYWDSEIECGWDAHSKWDEKSLKELGLPLN